MGYMPTINQPVDTDAALLVADSFGVKIELASVEDDLWWKKSAGGCSRPCTPSPVVTIMDMLITENLPARCYQGDQGH